LNKRSVFYLSSTQTILTALQEGYGVSLYIRGQETDRIQTLKEYALQADVEIKYLDNELAYKHKARNILLAAAAPKSVNLLSWLRNVPDSVQVVILDRIQDPYNVGAIVRSAVFFSFDLVILSQKQSAKVSNAVIYASSGAAYHIPVMSVGNLLQTIHLLKQYQFCVYGTDVEGTPLQECRIDKRYAVIIGNEQSGIRSQVRQTCDSFLSIQATTRMTSLNASVAAGIFFYALHNKTI